MTTVPEPSPWMEIAAELRRIADDAEKLADQPAPPHFELNIQPWSADDYRGVTAANRAATIASVDAVSLALIGKEPTTDKLSGGTFYRRVQGHRGRVSFSIYQTIADPDLVDKDEEIERLRARVAELEAGRPAEPAQEPSTQAPIASHYDASGVGLDDFSCACTAVFADLPALKWHIDTANADPTGLAYTRADDEPDDPTPVSGARVEPHVGGVTDEGLVDETPVEPVVISYFGDEPDPNAACAAHDDDHLGQPCPDRIVPSVHPDWVKHEHGCGGGRQCRCDV